MEGLEQIGSGWHSSCPGCFYEQKELGIIIVAMAASSASATPMDSRRE